jgi:hypothetical protein
MASSQESNSYDAGFFAGMFIARAPCIEVPITRFTAQVPGRMRITPETYSIGSGHIHEARAARFHLRDDAFVFEPRQFVSIDQLLKSRTLSRK